MQAYHYMCILHSHVNILYSHVLSFLIFRPSANWVYNKHSTKRGPLVQGLGLGDEALEVVRSFGLAKELDSITQPLYTEINRAVAPDGHVRQVYEDRIYNHRR